MATQSVNSDTCFTPQEETILPELDQEQAQEKPPMLLNEVSPEVQQKIDLIDAILQAPNRAARSKAIAEAALKLGKSPRTIKRMLLRVEHEGVATLAVGRKDKGQFRICEQWFKFIVAIHQWGQRDSSRVNHHQVHVHLMALASQGEKLRGKQYADRFKDYPEVLEDLVAGEYPSHVTVYKVINCYLEQESRKVRHPGASAQRQVIQTTEGIIELTHSNQVWQVDHTKLDVLLVDGDGEIIGRPFITLVMDSNSGGVAGFHLGFEAAGSHEVGLALRHAILPKQYGAEYELQNVWNIFGVPDYLMTDRAKEFKSEHLKQISLQLDFKRRLRAFPSAGGLIESIFDKINKEVLSFLPGYTGSSVEERPKNAEKSACVTLDELEKILVRYFVDHYNHHDYPKVKQQKRFERWQLMLLTEPEVLDERELDICLMKVARRKVEKYGSVRFEGFVYQGNCLVEYQGREISLRYDQRNIITLLAYTRSQEGQPGEFIGIVRARDLEREQISLEELRWIKRKLREQGKDVNNSSILVERLGIFEFVENKRKTKRQRRKAAQEQHEQKFNQSKVVELFPQNAAPEEVATLQENVTCASHTPSQEAVESINEQSQPEVSRATRRRRSRVSVPDWNQFMRDNW